ILAPDFRIEIEKYISPGLHTPMVVSHKNLDNLYFKILKYNGDAKKFNEFQNAADKDKQKRLNEIFQAYPLEKEFRLNLKSFDDYQEHSTLAKLDPMKSGQYLVLASTDPEFRTGTDGFVLKYRILEITAYSIVFRNDEILVTKRETGHPVINKKINVYEY